MQRMVINGAGEHGFQWMIIIHSMAKCSAPVWCHGVHACLIDKPINDALRIVTRFLHPTPTENLFILVVIQPTELRRQKAVIFLTRRAQKPEPEL